MAELPPMKGYREPPVLVQQCLVTFQEMGDKRGKRIGKPSEPPEPPVGEEQA